jgi:hypothetical protein
VEKNDVIFANKTFEQVFFSPLEDVSAFFQSYLFLTMVEGGGSWLFEHLF